MELTEEIIKNNCILAWFITPNHEINHGDHYFLPRLSTNDNGDDWILKQHLLFHDDWNWIMMVCEKIEKLGYIIHIFSDCDNSEITIEESGYHYVTHSFVEDINKLRGLNKVCLEFVIQYNEGTLKQAKK